MSQWILETDDRLGVKTCLPADLDRSNLLDITTIYSAWCTYVDRDTGEIHDCEVYYKQMVRTTVINMEDYR